MGIETYGFSCNYKNIHYLKEIQRAVNDRPYVFYRIFVLKIYFFDILK